MAPIYARGQTAAIDDSGRVRPVDLEPADARQTGTQIDTIRRRYGARGLSQTLHGLQLTRGAEFVESALRSASAATRTHQLANVSGGTEDRLGQAGGAVPSALTSAVQGNGGRALPGGLRERLEHQTGETLSDVQIHDTPAAHEAAEAVGARAFALGRSVYFGAGEYRPATRSGQELLAHEVAHTVQQRGASIPSPGQLAIRDSSDRHEHEADAFARAFDRGAPAPALSASPSLGSARVQRAISFARSNDAFTTNAMGATESAAGFQLQAGTRPMFQWTADVQINGNAGDACGNWEVGPHQLVRSFSYQATWGSGANQGTRRCTITGFPMRDATAAGNTWYHDPLARSFGACGDTRNTGLNDSPQTALLPWASPVAGKAGGPRGTFRYGAAFVAYISARDTTAAAGTFRDLGAVYWNVGLTGTFDTAQPVGSRAAASGGAVNVGNVINGGSGEFPAMHGGAIGNDSFVCTDT